LPNSTHLLKLQWERPESSAGHDGESSFRFSVVWAFSPRLRTMRGYVMKRRRYLTYL